MRLKVLLVGRKLNIVDDARSHAMTQDAELFAATDVAESVSILNEHRMDAVIMGAGVDLAGRLAIARAAFERSDETEVHMKDSQSGPEGFLPFVEDLLVMLRKSRADAA